MHLVCTAVRSSGVVSALLAVLPPALAVVLPLAALSPALPALASALGGVTLLSWQLAQFCGSGSMEVSVWWQDRQSTP